MGTEVDAMAEGNSGSAKDLEVTVYGTVDEHKALPDVGGSFPPLGSASAAKSTLLSRLWQVMGLPCQGSERAVDRAELAEWLTCYLAEQGPLPRWKMERVWKRRWRDWSVTWGEFRKLAKDLEFVHPAGWWLPLDHPYMEAAA